MIKTTAIPQNNNYNLAIPNQYIGKKIEILFYALDELGFDKSIPLKKTLSDFSGTLSEIDYQLLKNHTEKARNEWNIDI